MDSFKGTKALQSFSPGWADPELLEKTLIGRRELVDRFEELVIDGAGGPNKHQRLIVGSRGSGKTHVLRVLHNRLWRNEDIRDRLLIVYLLEDELGVASFLDFVVRLLRAVLRWYPEQTGLSKDLEELYDLPLEAQEPRAVQLLLNTAGQKDVLIIMENLAITFDENKGFGLRGQQSLRDLVQRHPHFMIFASSQALDQSIKDSNAPFYGFFKVIHLRRLGLEEAMTFLTTMASAYGKENVVDFLNTERGRGRMHAIYDFTGGNHRLLVVFYEFLTTDSIARLSELFIQALGPLKPYYQEQMRSLSAQQQKIVQYLSLERTPRTVKDIARACLAAPNTISSQLKNLLDRNFVSRIQQGRESYYEIVETLFRICHEAELDHEGAPVRLFVDFLANLYTAEELRLRQRGFSLLAGRIADHGRIPFAEEAEFYSRAISLYHPDLAAEIPGASASAIKPEEDIRSLFEEMEKTGAYREIIQFADQLAEGKDAFVLHTEARAYEELGEKDKAVVHAREAIAKDADDVEAHTLLARILSEAPEERDAALRHAKTAYELAPENPHALESLGIVKGMSGDHAGALRNFETLTEQHAGYARGWLLTGRALEELGRAQEAEAMYRKALELDAENGFAVMRLGILVGIAGKHEEALEHSQALNELRPEYSLGWTLTGSVLEELGRTQEAEAMYRKALDLDPNNAMAWAGLSSIMDQVGNKDDAERAFQEAVQLGAEKSNLFNRRGEANRRRGEYRLAIEQYEEALRADANAVLPHFNMVSALLALGRTDEALVRLRLGIESDRRASAETSRSWPVVLAFSENCVALFENAATASFSQYLAQALAIIDSEASTYTRHFEESLPLTVFALLKDHEKISEKRFAQIVEVFENVIGKRMEVSVAVRFLQVGIDYLKMENRKALMRLSKEERNVFCKELGID